MTALMWLQDWDPWLVGCTACDWTTPVVPTTVMGQAAAESAFRGHARRAHGGVTRSSYVPGKRGPA